MGTAIHADGIRQFRHHGQRDRRPHRFAVHQSIISLNVDHLPHRAHAPSMLDTPRLGMHRVCTHPQTPQDILAVRGMLGMFRARPAHFRPRPVLTDPKDDLRTPR